MAGGYRFRWNERALARVLGAGGPIDQAADRAAGRVRDRAKQNISDEGLVDTGLLRQSIYYERKMAGSGRLVYVIGTKVPYARYHEFGTGPWIYPQRAKVLRFMPRGSKSFVFAPRVRGVKATHFLRNAAHSLKVPGDFLP